jgi:hypothetical protein
MVTNPLVDIRNIDSKVWNPDKVLLELIYFIKQHGFLTVSTAREGPCLQASGIEDLILSACEVTNLELNKVELFNGNLLKSSKRLSEITVNCLDELSAIQQVETSVSSHDIRYNFGHFIGRSNWQRLFIATELYTNYKQKTLQTFHWQPGHDYHKSHLGFENFVDMSKDLETKRNMLEFLEKCPIKLTDEKSYPILQDRSIPLVDAYNEIFVDVVCETYFSGTTFFITDKTWRPILMKRPFIVQGPQYFLENLRRLGFKTFDSWWSEEYDNCHSSMRVYEMIPAIYKIGHLSNIEVQNMYSEMEPILEHNRNVLMELAWEEIKNCSYQYPDA